METLVNISGYDDTPKTHGIGDKFIYPTYGWDVKTSLDFNNVKPYFDLLQFKYNFITLGQKDFLI